MSLLAHLTSIGSNGDLANVGGGWYSVVITGLIYFVCLRIHPTRWTGNPNLISVGNILDIQLGASGGTYVWDNPALCFTAPLQWAQRKESLIAYDLSQV